MGLFTLRKREMYLNYGDRTDHVLQQIIEKFNPVIINRGEYSFIITPRHADDMTKICDYLISIGFTNYSVT